VNGAEPKNVLDYKVGMYFGELALLKNQPRAASIVVMSEKAKVVSLDRKTFINLMGPLKDLLLRNVQMYL